MTANEISCLVTTSTVQPVNGALCLHLLKLEKITRSWRPQILSKRPALQTEGICHAQIQVSLSLVAIWNPTTSKVCFVFSHDTLDCSCQDKNRMCRHNLQVLIICCCAEGRWSTLIVWMSNSLGDSACKTAFGCQKANGSPVGTHDWIPKVFMLKGALQS